MRWKFWTRSTTPTPVQEEPRIEAAHHEDTAATQSEHAGQTVGHAAPLPVSAKQLATLQRLIGNQAVGRLLAGGQHMPAQLMCAPEKLASRNEAQ
jgi:hypothetical protein